MVRYSVQLETKKIVIGTEKEKSQIRMRNQKEKSKKENLAHCTKTPSMVNINFLSNLK